MCCPIAAGRCLDNFVVAKTLTHVIFHSQFLRRRRRSGRNHAMHLHDNPSEKVGTLSLVSQHQERMDIATSMAESFVEELYRVSLNEPEEAVAAPLLQDYSTPALEASRVRWRAVMTNGIITRWEKMGPPTPPTDPGSVAAPSASAPTISAGAAASSAGPKVKPPMRGSVALTPSVPAAVLQKRFEVATTAAQAEELAPSQTWS